ncbi:Copia protein [Durusdinium trenchii]|uniref:Copia protein n=2 Tax=Durusdinium trenchii TaxID=1381693 RepID=A0ABP0P7Z7_9DINO
MEKGREASQKPVTLLGDRERRSQSWLKPAVVAGIILLLVWADVPYAVVGALVREMVSALRGLPEALGKLSKPKGLIDPRGLGKPQILGDNADEKFRLWAIKLEDYVSGVFGGKSREVLEWAAGMDAEITPAEIDASFGGSADILEQWDEVHEFNEQLYTVLRVVSGNIVSIVKKGGKGDGKGNANKIKFDGHKKAECWSAQGKGKGQKGGGGKGNNNKNSANALDLPEPEPRPGDANGLELCALEVCTLEEARERSSVRSESQRASTLRSESHRASTRTRSSRRRTESSAADRSASSVESSDSVEKPWLKCNLDTGTSVTVFPKDMFEAGEPNDMRLKTASGEVVKAYGKATVHGKDTRGLMRKLNGGGRRPQDPGGEIIPLNHPVSKAMITAYHKAVDEFDKMGIIPVYEENGVYNFYLYEERRTSGRDEQHMDGWWKCEAKEFDDKITPTWLEDEGGPGDQGGEAEQGPEELEIHEARPARPGWTPDTPSDLEKKEHEASGHAVYRSWRPECIQAAGRVQQHRRVPREEETTSTVVMDYFYLNEEEGARFLELLGYKEIVLKSDGEHSLVRMKKAAGRDAKNLVKTICEESPAGDSRANGEAEAAVREIKWRIKAIHLMLEKKFDGGLPEGHPLTLWIPRYVAEQSNRYKVGADGVLGMTSEGEGAVEDIEDLFRSEEDERAAAAGASPATIEAIEWMTELMGSLEAAQTLADLAAMDVIEVFSPSRVNKEVERFGLRLGAAIDLEELKPDGSEKWDLDHEADFQLALDMIAYEQPYLVTSSPPCTTFSPLRRLSDFKRDKKIVEEEKEIGKARLKKAMACCKLQLEQGGFFLHEHPKESTSWKEPEVQEMLERKDIHLVQSPMCKFGMKMSNDDGEQCYVRKETLWMTNSKCIAEELQGVCINKLKGQEVHRHVHLIGRDRAKAAQVYPVPLVEAILRGLKKELVSTNALSAVEEMLTGPSPDNGNEMDMELRAWEEEQYMDDVMVAKEIKKAKPAEMQLGGADTFSATPPIEAVYTLLSAFMSKDPKKGELKLANWDISRAHFMGRAARDIFMELPEQDRVQPTDQEPMVAKLMRSMYGTQDASKIFEEDYQGWLKQNGGTFCSLCPAIFRFEERGLLGLVHGDDFLVVGEYAQLRWLDGILNKKYTAKWENLVGDGPGDKRSMTFLNRLIKYIPDGADLEIEADTRHAEILLREFGFNETTKGCDIPEDKMTQADLTGNQCLRAGRTLASAMKGPKMGDWQRLKKAVRYLVTEPYLKRIFKEQPIKKFNVDKVFDKELEVIKVAGKMNDADLVTKVQPRAVIQAHLQRLGFERSGRQGHKGLT